MGSSSSRFWRGYDPDEASRKIRNEEARALEDAFETAVNRYLAQQLSEYNDRDVDAVARILRLISTDLAEEAGGVIDLLFGGSVAKHTYVDGLSDVDALVLFDRTELSDSPPAALRELLAQITRSRYGREHVTVGNLAVTAEIQGQTIQLLPALRTSTGYKISSWDGQGWIHIHPEEFADRLTSANKRNGGKLIPTIKLVKAITATLPEKQQLTGYHTEALAIEAFKDYEGPSSPKAMVLHFFSQASSLTRRPMADPTGQSSSLDGYLGEPDSTQRRTISLAVDRIARRIRNADAMRSLDQWKELLGDR
jgi:hypothetical protein